MDIPSLFMIPSAVSSGKVHSVFPNSTDADFDFNRDSSATRVNSQGLIEEVGYFGSELVTNGTFDNNLNNWNLAAGGQTIVWENGKVRLTTDGTFASLQQTITTVVGKVYRARVDIDVTSGSNLALNIGGTQVFGNGKRTLEMLFTATGTATQFQLKRYSGAVSGTFDNATFVEVQGDRARLNYEIEGGLVNTKPSLLLEPQSTNLITYSEDFSQSAWSKANSSITSNSVISPDGSSNADKIVENTANNVHLLSQGNISVISGEAYTFSFFAKAGERNEIEVNRLNTSGTVFNGIYQTTVDLTNGTITEGSNITNSSIENYSNGWFRISITLTAIANGVGGITLYLRKNGSVSYTGDGVSGIYIYGAQAEQQSYPTSYIPTNGSVQSRANETCNGAGTSSILPSEEGILYAEIAALANDGTTKRISINDDTDENVIQIYHSSTVNRIVGRVAVGNTTQASLVYDSATVTEFNKIAINYKENDFALWINGIKLATDTSGSTFSANTLSKLSFNRGDGGNPFYGKVRDIRVYNTKEMTDSEVDILLTKITS